LCRFLHHCWDACWQHPADFVELGYNTLWV
jgi:hypothetical protein